MTNLLAFDEQLFHWINSDWQNAFLDAVMPWWRDKKTWIPLYIALAGFMWYRFRLRGVYLMLALALTVGVADGVSSHLIKKTVKRIRPCNDATLQQPARIVASCGGGYSFTSSHATNHFAIATFLSLTLGLFYRKIRLLFYLWAASIAIGQVYIGVHYPLDIIGGALLGTLIAMAMARWYWRLPSIRIERPSVETVRA